MGSGQWAVNAKKRERDNSSEKDVVQPAVISDSKQSTRKRRKEMTSLEKDAVQPAVMPAENN